MSLNGLFINTHGNSLDKATLGEQELKLLATGDGVDIMIQEIQKGIPFAIYPVEVGSTLMEFCYILEGEVEHIPTEGSSTVLKAGDYFYTKKLMNSCLFKTISYVKLLYISTQPMFHFLGESLNDLKKFNFEIEQKDSYTHGHSERVRDYAIKIALEMALGRETVIKIALAALFHDVGKVKIPDEILKKPAKLNDSEYEIMKQHVNYGAELVKKIRFIYYDISEVVLQHHEKINGTGYPFGLTDKDILIESKIVAVADAFDTMTTHRPYRQAISYSDAIEELNNLAGIHYDKDVVLALTKVLKKENII